MKQSQRIAKNLSVGGLTIAVAGILQSATFIVIARFVSVSDYGAFNFMFSFGMILERFADSGLNSILMRDMAVDRDRIGELLGAAMTLALPYIAIACLVMAGVIPFFHFDHRLAVLTATMGIARLVHVFIGYYSAVLLSQENWELHGICFVLHKVLLFGFVLGALLLGTGLGGAVVAHFLAIVPPLLLMHWIVSRRYARPHLRFDLKLWKYLVREAIPVGGAGVVRLVAEPADIFVATAVAGTMAAGFFSGPSRLASGLRYLPGLVINALFPLYSRTAAASGPRTEFAEAYERGVKWFAFVGMVMALPFLLCPAAITTGLLGAKYAPAIPATRIISITVWLIFASGPYFLLLTALGRQRFLFISTTAALILRIVFDYILTRKYGFLGPCIGMNLSDGLLLVAWVACMWQEGFPLKIFAVLWRPCVAAVPVGALLHLLAANSLLLLVLVFPPALLLYVALLFVLGAFTESEISQFKEAMRFWGPFVAQWTRREEPEMERRAS
ncbi:MAG TPA: oligosaccharide flippase family protein [Candidatus Binataceae bacterium]|jgi:O-antigen/teichoic acid export membrane protein|nr:oligosaccharide flippase family protein [Candidatus Binataceae bacterium]